jgi:hypothetical protein
MWQDWVLMIGGFAFSASLIYSIVTDNKPSEITSITTFIVLCAFWACYYTLGLLLASISTGLTAVCWLILFLQKRSK